MEPTQSFDRPTRSHNEENLRLSVISDALRRGIDLSDPNNACLLAVSTECLSEAISSGILKNAPTSTVDARAGILIADISHESDEGKSWELEACVTFAEVNAMGDSMLNLLRHDRTCPKGHDAVGNLGISHEFATCDPLCGNSGEPYEQAAFDFFREIGVSSHEWLRHSYLQASSSRGYVVALTRNVLDYPILKPKELGGNSLVVVAPDGIPITYMRGLLPCGPLEREWTMKRFKV
jgi:hypothetical protein